MMDNVESKTRIFSADIPTAQAYVFKEPYIEIIDDKMYKVEDVSNQYGIGTSKRELVITKEVFVEAYNKWIKDTNNDK